MENQNDDENGTVEEIEKKTGFDPILLAAVGSVALAWFQFYVRGNRHHGLFIGLWPPTLLAFSTAIRNQQQQTSREQDDDTV